MVNRGTRTAGRRGWWNLSWEVTLQGGPEKREIFFYELTCNMVHLVPCSSDTEDKKTEEE